MYYNLIIKNIFKNQFHHFYDCYKSAWIMAIILAKILFVWVETLTAMSDDYSIRLRHLMCVSS